MVRQTERGGCPANRRGVVRCFPEFSKHTQIARHSFGTVRSCPATDRIRVDRPLIRASALAAIELMGFALSSQYAFAQATYNYTGGPLGAMPPFTPSMHVSATLQLGSWLPPNQHCIYVFSQMLIGPETRFRADQCVDYAKPMIPFGAAVCSSFAARAGTPQRLRPRSPQPLPGLLP